MFKQEKCVKKDQFNTNAVFKCNSVLCTICNTFLPAFSSASFSEYLPLHTIVAEITFTYITLLGGLKA